MCFTLVSSVGYEFKSNPLKFELQIWIQGLILAQPILVVLGFSIGFNFGEFIKMNFLNKPIQTIVSFQSIKFVLCNGAIGWYVW